MRYEFDKAMEYLELLLKECDAGVMANCINLAVNARNTTGSGLKNFKYATPREGQEVVLQRDYVPVRLNFVLTDNNSEEYDTKVAGSVKVEHGFLEVYFDGYGEPEAAKGYGSPAFFELYEGKLRAIITPNILEESSRKIISLEKAKESLVTDWEDGE